MINLQRPLVCLDLEATGTDPEEARIIQVAIRRFEPITSAVNGETGVHTAEEYSQIVNPGTPVDPEILELTGITQDQLDNGRPWHPVAKEVYQLIRDADLLGYNIVRYDYPLLEAEFSRLDWDMPGPEDRKIVDAYALEKRLNPRTLENTFRRYTGEQLDGAHNAEADVNATWRVLTHQCVVHDLKGATPADLVDTQRGDYLDSGGKLKEVDGGVQVCFGKHEGKTLSELQEEAPDYLRWVYDEITELRPFLDQILE